MKSFVVAAFVALGVGAIGCGSAPDIVREVGRALEKGADSVTDAADTAADAVADGGKASVNAVKRQVHEYLDKPPLEQRRRMCDQEGGSWAEVIEVGPCREGRAQVTIGDRGQTQACAGVQEGGVFEHQCLHADPNSTWYFNDGPSVPHVLAAVDPDILGWNEIFWPAAVNHDYCYHHGQATYGYDRDTCDEQMLDDLLAICEADVAAGHPHGDGDSAFTPEGCSKQAHRAYMALVYGGEDNFDAMNTQAQYPAYEPIWRKRGLGGVSGDDRMRQMIRQRPLDAVGEL